MVHQCYVLTQHVLKLEECRLFPFLFRILQILLQLQYIDDTSISNCYLFPVKYIILTVWSIIISICLQGVYYNGATLDSSVTIA